ncbi:GTPase HflX [Fonticella tunisiensis]|uniref:GTPase HflX n=1 Tax=Fonticella tunisiensis TaxID=1096341 RepID=A0A4R7KA54_9CLOT|nr:GTPase HflX [Fonticella tunisiensis]TDT47642.1 GTP-binding protein HflX [Fonticella tunisiensis]
MIRGNLEGIKKIYIEALDRLLEKEMDKNYIIDLDVMKEISRISSEMNREISIYVNRRGKVVDVAVGDSSTAPLEAMTEKRGEMGLCGVRCIHTHPGGTSMLSPADMTALISLRFDCMMAIGVKDGEPEEFTFGYLDVENGKLKDNVVCLGPYKAMDINRINILNIIEEIESELHDKTHRIYEDRKERVIIVGGVTCDLYTPEESLNELQELVETAGGEVIHKVLQKRGKIDPAYYIGSGKARELGLLRQSLMADTVVFDDELSGAQVRNLEEAVGCKVIDRTTLILDIFAQRAISREGKIQVELAQLKYRLPRLMGLGNALSRTGGGIGTRGPGEKKLEIDRRHIRSRILDLERELENIKKTRALQRERRKANEIPVVAIAGYTNAGKSTLRNKLCEIAGVDKEKVLEANMLFATLDTTTRVVTLPSGKDVLLSDTVGFIRKLPHELVMAFKSTLEEVIYSDLILHVVDASNKNAPGQIETVNRVLSELGVQDKNILLVFNKVDAAEPDALNILRAKFGGGIEISALEGTNLNVLLSLIEKELYKDFIKAALIIPYGEGKVLSYLHDNNCIEREEYREEGIYVEIKTTEDIFGRVKKYQI